MYWTDKLEITRIFIRDKIAKSAQMTEEGLSLLRALPDPPFHKVQNRAHLPEKNIELVPFNFTRVFKSFPY